MKTIVKRVVSIYNYSAVEWDFLLYIRIGEYYNDCEWTVLYWYTWQKIVFSINVGSFLLCLTQIIVMWHTSEKVLLWYNCIHNQYTSCGIFVSIYQSKCLSLRGSIFCIVAITHLFKLSLSIITIEYLYSVTNYSSGTFRLE